MENIQLYYKKIDRMINGQQSSAKKKGNGLLSPSTKVMTDSPEGNTDQMKVIADIVAGIREARKEMMNGK